MSAEAAVTMYAPAPTPNATSSENASPASIPRVAATRPATALRDRSELRSSAHFNQTSAKSCDNGRPPSEAPPETARPSYTTGGASAAPKRAAGKRLAVRGFAVRIRGALSERSRHTRSRTMLEATRPPKRPRAFRHTLTRLPPPPEILTRDTRRRLHGHRTRPLRPRKR